MYNYYIYKSTDVGNPRLNAARKDFGYEGQDMYVITKDGEIALVQSENCRPYSSCGLEECAKRHIADLQSEK